MATVSVYLSDWGAKLSGHQQARSGGRCTRHHFCPIAVLPECGPQPCPGTRDGPFRQPIPGRGVRQLECGQTALRRMIASEEPSRPAFLKQRHSRVLFLISFGPPDDRPSDAQISGRRYLVEPSSALLLSHISATVSFCPSNLTRCIC